MNRRDFFSSAAAWSVSLLLAGRTQQDVARVKNENSFRAGDKGKRTGEVFTQIIERARKEGWESLSIGECMGNVGLLLLGTEYAPGTLEGEGPEICRADLAALDCVTFFENVLCLARILKQEKTTFDDFLAELAFTRYRNGKLTDYTSRLHYTSDWIYDNERKKVVKDITPEIGGEIFPVKVSFMSRHPQNYPALKEFPEFIGTVSELERKINLRQHWYIPQRKIKGIQKHIQTGDIVAVATNREGLDYTHTGLAFRDEKGRVRLLHASQKERMVCLDKELYKYIRSVETGIGITVARPLEVEGAEAAETL
jgi:hypothetical protein